MEWAGEESEEEEVAGGLCRAGARASLPCAV